MRSNTRRSHMHDEQSEEAKANAPLNFFELSSKRRRIETTTETINAIKKNKKQANNLFYTSNLLMHTISYLDLTSMFKFRRLSLFHNTTLSCKFSGLRDVTGNVNVLMDRELQKEHGKNK